MYSVEFVFMSGESNLRDVQIISSLDQAAALMDETRLAVIRALTEPDSASGVARRLGLPRQRVNYHLRALEKAGLVEFVREQRRGNCTERVVRATARRYVVNPDLMGLGPATESSPVAERLILEASRLVAAVIANRADGAAGDHAASIGTITVRFANVADRRAFVEDLTAEAARLVAEYDDPMRTGSKPVRFLMAGWTPTEGPGG
ncbi:MAG: transcriptional regulator [Phycisphaerae bacterium]|nr:MAG: transcriptional regulator [Phycisphaerae bacterium]